MFKNYTKKDYAVLLMNILMALCLVGCIANTAIKYFFSSISLQGFGVTDYMINYQGGFVRRGLIGEIIFRFYQYTGINPVTPILAISTCSLVFLLYFFLKNFRKHNLCWWILPLNICLMGAFFLRKDYLCGCLIVLALSMYGKIKNIFLKLFTVNIILIFALNVHECFFFMIIPMLTLLIFFDKSLKISKYGRLLALVPIYSVFILLLIYKGNPQIASIIHQSWNLPEMGPEPTGTIASLDMTFSGAFKKHVTANFLTESAGLYGFITKPLVWILSFFLIPNLLFRKYQPNTAQSQEAVRSFVKVYLFQFISLFPMLTVLSCDQSRIFFYWNISAFIIYLMVPVTTINSIFPALYNKMSDRICNALIIHNFYGKVFIYLTLFFICISPVGTCVPFALEKSVAGHYYTAANRKIAQLIKICTNKNSSALKE